MVHLREFVFDNERHPESGRAVSLARNGGERLQSAGSGEIRGIRGDPRDPGDPGRLYQKPRYSPLK